jgi:hypothetical protein
MKTIYEHDKGFGYAVSSGKVKIKQDFKPCYGGNIAMTEAEATALAGFIDAKLTAGLSAGVNKEQMKALWDKTKTVQNLIDEEKKKAIIVAR